MEKLDNNIDYCVHLWLSFINYQIRTDYIMNIFLPETISYVMGRVSL